MNITRSKLRIVIAAVCILALVGVALWQFAAKPASDSSAAKSPSAIPAAVPPPSQASTPSTVANSATAQPSAPSALQLPRANYFPRDPSWPVSPQANLLLSAKELAAAVPVLHPDGSATRERILRTRSFKYPLLRSIETFRPRSGGPGFEARPEVLLSVADHVLVQPSRPLSPAEADTLAASIGGTVRKQMPLSGNLLIAFDGAQPGALAAAHAVLARQPLVTTAEPDHLVHAFATTPNDPDFAKLWGLHNTGQTVNNTAGSADADIDAPEAWDVSTGSRNVVVAVLDTGVDVSHPDLKDNIAANLGEIPGNGIDDDTNGFIDDYSGWDFAEGDNNPFDGNSHGTHCAGSIGASGHDGSGIVGVNWQVSILPVKFLDDGGSGASSDAIEAIHYTRIRGARISSNSWGGGATSDAMKSAIDQAGEAGQIFVAAAGNNGNSTPQYPAAYTSTNILTVAASNSQDGIASFSCFDDGSGWVDVAAPGVSIYSTMPGGVYGFKDGTSMATPHVAGIMGLIVSIRPDIPVAEAIDWVKTTVDSKSAFNGKVTTGGRVNAHKALYNNLSTPLINLVATTFTDNGDGNGIPNPGETLTLSSQLRNVSSVAANSVNATLTLAAADPYLTITSGSATLGNLASRAQVTANFTFTVAANTPTPRAVTLNLTTVDAANNTRVTQIPVMLYSMAAVTGTVREIDGSPVAGALVSFAGPLRGSTTTGAGGAYALSLVDGSHELSISKNGYTPSAARLVQVPPAASGIDFVLARPRVIAGVAALTAAVGGEGQVSMDVPLVNDGSAPASFTVREMEYSHDKNGDAGGPVYNWVDISATAPALEVAELAFNNYECFNSGPLPLGMNFPYYENSFRSFRVNHMGWISFTNASRNVFDYRVELPDLDRPENMIAFAWAGQMDWTPWQPGDYMNPNYIAGARRLFYKQVDPQTSVITAHRWANGEFDLLSSQVILKRDGTILLQYGAYTGPQGGATTFHAGPRIYIAGMQDAKGRRGMTPVFGPTRIMPTNGTVIRMRPSVGAPWLKTDVRNGVLQPGDAAQNLRVTLDATGLAAGTYTTKLVLDTNDASQPTLEIPVTLAVGSGDSSLAWVTPVGGDNATPGATIPLEVQILGSTASVTGVNFFNGSTLLGAGVFSGTDRYLFDWTSVPAGSFDLVAVATLSDGRVVSTSVRPASAGTGFRVAIDAVDASTTTPATSNHRALVERFGSPLVNFETAVGTVYARPVTITRSGSTASVALPLSYLLRFGYINSLPTTESMTISGAAQPEYNGTHTLTYGSVSGSNYIFTFPVTGSPATPSTGAQISDFSRAVVSDSGHMIRLAGQASRKIALPAPYTVTSNTVLEFDFLGSENAGSDVFGVGLDNDNSLSASRIFQVWGNKTNWGSNRTYHNYIEDVSDSSAPRCRHYRIPVGQHFTGTQNYLILMQTTDDWYYRHDADATYRNVTLYEDPNAASNYTHQWTVTDAPSTRTGENMTQTWLRPGQKDVSLVTTLGEQSAAATRTVQIGGSGVFGASINFQPASAFTPIGYVPDSGAVFADRLNGFSYGWLGSANTSAVDAEYPIMSQFQELDTYIKQTTAQTWEIAVPNGNYRVYAAVGFAYYGATSATSNNWLKVEGQTLIDKNLPKDQFTDGITTVAVTDGKMTFTSHRNTAYVDLLDITRTDGSGIAPVASFTASVLGGIAPVGISFDASSSFVNNGSLVSYVWDFGDGGTATGTTPTHTFTVPGLHAVTLTVTDSTGATATSATAININGGSQTATSIVLTPLNPVLIAAETRQFSAVVNDQFGQPLTPQPAITWAVSGGGSISTGGLLTAGATVGSFTVTASASGLQATTGFTVTEITATGIFSAHFNHGTGSNGADNAAAAYNWNGAIGTSGTLVSNLNNVAVSRLTTSDRSVPVVSGQSTAAGFLTAIAASDNAGVSMLYSTSLETSATFQDNPQTNWFCGGNNALSGLKVRDIARLSVFTRPISTAATMRFALRVGADWFVSTTSFHQINTEAFEKRVLANLTAANTWYSGVFTPGSSLDPDLGNNPTVTLDADDAVTGYGWYADLDALTAANSRVRIDSFVIHANVNTAPSVAGPANQTLSANGATPALALTIGDTETAASALTLSATSSNLTLVPTANIVLGGSGANRTVTVTPAANQAGTATITVTVSDGALTASSAFSLTIMPTFSSWMTGYPGVGELADPTDDPDADGLASLLEYAMGSSPSASGSAPASQVSDSKLQLAFDRNSAASGVILVVQASSNLVTWTDIARSEGGAAMAPLVAGVTVNESGSGAIRQVNVFDSVTLDAATTRRFLRLRVTSAP